MKKKVLKKKINKNKRKILSKSLIWRNLHKNNKKYLMKNQGQSDSTWLIMWFQKLQKDCYKSAKKFLKTQFNSWLAFWRIKTSKRKMSLINRFYDALWLQLFLTLKIGFVQILKNLRLTKYFFTIKLKYFIFLE